MAKSKKQSNVIETVTNASVNETYTFIDSTGNFEFTIKRSFLQEVPEPEKIDIIELFKNANFIKSLHNPLGPAISHLKIKNKDIPNCYFLNGVPLQEDEVKKLIHNQEFGKGFNVILNNE